LETINGEIKERYVGPLADVVESYLKLKESNGIGGGGYPPQWGRRDLNPGPPAFWWLG
jgi:ORF D-335-like protein.